MDKQFRHISHKFIDSLSDGVFSIAITLLGLNVVELVPEISKSENMNTAIMENWPTFLSYLLGFVVLFSTWYQYHAGSQYVEGTTAWIVWQHGLAMAWVALMPFGVALLSHNLNTPNRKWAIFYFGVCLFGNYWTTMILLAFVKFKFKPSFNELLPIPEEVMRKATPIFLGFTALFGLIMVSISLLYPWVALGGYVAYVASNVSPVGTLNRVKPMLEKMVGAGRD
jgi:uncharacterized membrane protein